MRMDNGIMVVKRTEYLEFSEDRIDLNEYVDV